MTEKVNTYFTPDAYVSEIRLDVNEEVLERIYKSDVSAQSRLPIEFFYVSDREEKLKALGLYLMEKLPDYSSFKIGPYEDVLQLAGETAPIQMELGAINEWNKMMWDLGYAFDCKLDGWQVESKAPHS